MIALERILVELVVGVYAVLSLQGLHVLHLVLHLRIVPRTLPARSIEFIIGKCFGRDARV